MKIRIVEIRFNPLLGHKVHRSESTIGSQHTVIFKVTPTKRSSELNSAVFSFRFPCTQTILDHHNLSSKLVDENISNLMKARRPNTRFETIKTTNSAGWTEWVGGLSEVITHGKQLTTIELFSHNNELAVVHAMVLARAGRDEAISHVKTLFGHVSFKAR